MSTTTRRPATTPTADDGRGPRGLWWVAWRLHRRMLIGWAVVVGVAVVTLLAARQAYLAAEATAPCLDVTTFDGAPYCPNPLQLAMTENFLWWEALHAVLVVAPVIAGLLGGVAMFAAEFDRGTQVLALSQSVTRLRWFVVTAVTVTVPLVVGAAALGVATEATRRVVGTFGKGWYDHFEFATSGVVAAALCLLGVAAGCLTGLVLRSPLPAVLAGLVAVAAVIGVVSVYRSDLATPVRTVAPISGNVRESVPDTSWILDGGLLDADGADFPYGRCQTVDQAGWDSCLAENHVTSSWLDSIPIDRRSELQAKVAALLAAVSALGFAVGALILRRRRAV